MRVEDWQAWLDQQFLDKPPAPQKQEQAAPVSTEAPEPEANRASSVIKPTEPNAAENLASMLSLKPPVITGDNSLPNLADYLPQILAKKAPEVVVEPAHPDDPGAGKINQVTDTAPPPVAEQSKPVVSVREVSVQTQVVAEAPKMPESAPPQIVPLTIVELSELCQSPNRLFNVSLLNTDPIVKDDLSLAADRESRRSAIAGLLLPSRHAVPANSVPNSTEKSGMIEVAVIGKTGRPQKAVLLLKSDQPMHKLNELLSFLEAQRPTSSRKLAE